MKQGFLLGGRNLTVRLPHRASALEASLAGSCDAFKASRARMRAEFDTAGIRSRLATPEAVQLPEDNIQTVALADGILHARAALSRAGHGIC